MDPVRRFCTTRLSTCHSCSVLPGQLRPQQQLHRLGRAGQAAVLAELGQEERHQDRAGPRRGGAAAAARPCWGRSAAAWSGPPCARLRSRVTATHRCSAATAARASCSAEVSAFSCRALSTSTCRITSALSPSSSSRRAPQQPVGSAASAASSTWNRAAGSRRWCTARITASLPTPRLALQREPFARVVTRPRPDGSRAARARRRADQAGQGHAGCGAVRGGAGCAGRLDQLDVHDAAGDVSHPPRTGRQYIRAWMPLGSSTDDRAGPRLASDLGRLAEQHAPGRPGRGPGGRSRSS